MAIYTTFFVCQPEDLVRGFPGWLPPLPNPIRREVRNPLTKQMMVIETRKPEWPPEGAQTPSAMPHRTVTSIPGSYEDYLEGRIKPFVRGKLHWCAKGVTQIELDPLGEVLGLPLLLETALYAHPGSGASLQRLREELPKKLGVLDDTAIEEVASSWAARMSAPEFTHSVSGNKLSDGWTAEQAIKILQPLVVLSRQADPRAAMYLLTEA